MKNIKKSNFLLSIIAPIYNESDNVFPFYEEIRPILDGCSSRWEIIFINDGSKDSSLDAVLSLHFRDKRVKVINFSRNFGKESALSAGLKHSLGDAVIPIDVDLQDPTELIVDMCRYWQDGYYIVNAKRDKRDGESFFKLFSAKLFYKVINILAQNKIPENVGDYRLFDRKVVDELNKLGERNRFMKGLFAWVGFKQKEILFTRRARHKGKTSFNFLKLLNFAIDGITSFSSAPLRIFSYVGSFTLLASFLYLIFILIKTLLLGVEVPGYASLVILILFFGGINLFAIGIMGEYVGRIYSESKGRSLYIIEDIYE